MIITHPHLDLDAASSVALEIVAGEHTVADVQFLPANAKEVPPHMQGGVLLDHPLGGKGEKSALAEMDGATQMLGHDFVAEVDEHDSTGFATPRTPLARLFAAARVAYRARGLSGAKLDQALLDWWLVAVEGIAIQEKQKKAAEQSTEDIPIVEAGGALWAVPRGPTLPKTGDILARQGVSGYIYDTSYGLGIYRYPQFRTPDLSVLTHWLPGWFVHKNGFLACWGSRKAPQKQRPPTLTPQNRIELAETIRCALG